MNFSDISELRKLDSEVLDEKIISIQKELADLRLKKATRQEFKPHEFKGKKIKSSTVINNKKSERNKTIN
jgi:ribosomal protein L29